jgi:hypothetical protein
MSIPKVLERMGGLQAQYAPSMYIGLWTRLEGFSRADLDGALRRRTVVQGTLLRSKPHARSSRRKPRASTPSTAEPMGG